MREVRSTQAAWYQTFLYKHYTMLAVISGNIAELCRVSELKANLKLRFSILTKEDVDILMSGSVTYLNSW